MKKKLKIMLINDIIKRSQGKFQISYSLDNTGWTNKLRRCRREVKKMSDEMREFLKKIGVRIVLVILCIQQAWYCVDQLQNLTYATEDEKDFLKYVILVVAFFWIVRNWRKPAKGKTVKMEPENYFRLLWTAIFSTIMLWKLNEQTIWFSMAIWALPVARGGGVHLPEIVAGGCDRQDIACCIITVVQTFALYFLYEGSNIQFVVLILGIVAMWMVTYMVYPKRYQNKYLNAFLEWGSQWSFSEAVATCILCSALMLLFIYIQEEFRIESENMERVIRLSKVMVIMLPRAVHKYCFADLMRRHDPIGLKEEIKSLWTQEKREKRAMMFFVGISIFSALAYAYTRDEELGKTFFVMGMILCGIATIMAFNEDEESLWYG